jgi:glutamine synthetase
LDFVDLIFLLEKLISFKGKVDNLVANKNMKKDDAIFNILRDQIKEIKPILFEGDGYSKTWIKEAKKRKLSHNKSTPEALSAYLFKKSINLFSSLGILSQREIEARYIVDLQEYTMRIQIEARTLGDISRNHIIPTAINYQNTLIENVRGLKEIYGKDFKKHATEQMSIIERISEHVAAINSGVNSMISSRKKANEINDPHKKAIQYSKKVLTKMDLIRYHCDKLELLVDNTLWPLAKYRELLFSC